MCVLCWIVVSKSRPGPTTILCWRGRKTLHNPIQSWPLMGRRLIFPPSCNVSDTMYDSVSGVLRAECHGEWLLPVVTGLVNVSAPSRSPSLLLCCPFYPSQDYTCHDNPIVSPRLGYIGQGGLYWFHWHNTLPLIGTQHYCNKKAVLPQGNRAMPQVFFSVEVRQQHSLQV